MNKDDLRRLADNPNFISGIYNYCDRWCERCTFTARCMNYAMGAEEDNDPDAHDLESTQFWEKFSQVMETTLELLHDIAEREGFEPLSEEEWAEHTAEEDRKWATIQTHPAVVTAEAYIEAVDEWLTSAGDLFQTKEDELNAYIRLNISGVDPDAKAAELIDAIEVIRWYQLFIQVKLIDALHGKEDKAGDERWDSSLEDSDGSAKIALIAMDRSLAAWTMLLRAFPQRETETMRLLAHLDRLRQQTEQEFPQARAFVRPGFDGIVEEEEAEGELWAEVWDEMWNETEDEKNVD